MRPVGHQFEDFASSPLRVLLADDDYSVLQVVDRVVRFLGHIVVGTAVTGTECIQRAKELRPDLVIADLTMLGRDGIETASKISQSSRVPVIIMTGANDDETIRRLAEANIAGHLPKPFTLDDMAVAIENATAPALV
jgi:response regulator NasT